MGRSIKSSQQSKLYKNLFQQAVEKVDDIKNAYRAGLHALAPADQPRILIASPRKLEGSVDIDSTTCAKYPNDTRWDYVIAYSGLAYYVEVHPATNGEVKVMKSKKLWLQQWLKDKAEALNTYPSAKPRMYWIQSGKCGLLKTSPEYKQAAVAGLIPQPNLSLV